MGKRELAALDARLALRAAEMARVAADLAYQVKEMSKLEGIKVRAEACYGQLVDLESALRVK